MANTNVVPKKCDKCGKVTKGIWKTNALWLCYICYQKTKHMMPNNRKDYSKVLPMDKI